MMFIHTCNVQYICPLLPDIGGKFMWLVSNLLYGTVVNCRPPVWQVWQLGRLVGKQVRTAVQWSRSVLCWWIQSVHCLWTSRASLCLSVLCKEIVNKLMIMQIF